MNKNIQATTSLTVTVISNIALNGCASLLRVAIQIPQKTIELHNSDYLAVVFNKRIFRLRRIEIALQKHGGAVLTLLHFLSVFFRFPHCATYHHVVYPEMTPGLCHRISAG